jgi:hypothetical protein
MRKQPRAPMRRAMSSLFARRTVIVIPPYGWPIIGIAIAFGLVETPVLVTNAIAFILGVTALLVTIAARRNLRELRYAMHSALNDIENDEVPESVMYDDSHEIVLKKLKVNGATSDRARVSE